MPDTVYVIGSNQYGEQPCNTNGVGCGNGRSNGREVLYSTTAGDPDGARTSMRTFTDLSYDAHDQPPRRGARSRRTSTTGASNAPNGIHPDQHVIVINPGNPTQIFEGSDGGMIRTSGAFADISSQCDDAVPQRRRPAADDVGQLHGVQAAAVAGADDARAHRQEAEQHAAVHQRRDQPVELVRGHGRHAGQRHVVEHRTAATTTRSTQVIYGDGGNAGYDATNPTWRFNEFTGGFSDSNFRNGDPEKWVITSAPIVNSGEAPGVLLAADRRPEPGARHAPDLLGRAARLADAGPSAPGTPATSRRTRRRTSRATRRTARSS